MKKTLATIALTVAATLTVAPTTQSAVSAQRSGALSDGPNAGPSNADSHERPQWMNRTCQTEGSNNCFWDAGKSGNGVGRSFYSHRIGKVICIMYAKSSYAKHHDYCYDAA